MVSLLVCVFCFLTLFWVIRAFGPYTYVGGIRGRLYETIKKLKYLIL